jgi:hypothetical protein
MRKRVMLRRDVASKLEADNRGVAEGEDGYCKGTTGLPVGLHLKDYLQFLLLLIDVKKTSDSALPAPPGYRF